MENRLICDSHLKSFILAKAESMRPGWGCRRVSGAAMDKIEAKVRAMVIKMVASHPTLGQTFKEVV